MTPSYGPGLKRNDALNFLSKAIDLGYDFFDTATIYGLGENEKLVGEALKTNRNSFLIASKCVLGFADGKRFLDGRPSTIKAACEASLERLQTEVIDLYYMHRPDPKVPIEESVGALANLKKEGKIRMLGLSEMSGHPPEHLHIRRLFVVRRHEGSSRRQSDRATARKARTGPRLDRGIQVLHLR